MSYLAEAAVSAPGTWPATDFMRRAYELNGEPLRMLEPGQRWFARILKNEFGSPPRASALVLGATPWLSTLLHGTATRTTVADTSTAMLSLCASAVPQTNEAGNAHSVRYLHANWLALPGTVRGLHLVAGDNAFSFLRCPDEWEQVLDSLAGRMTKGALLCARLLSVPAVYRRTCPAEIVQQALARRVPVNFTAVRVALLFAHWDSIDYTIHPEDALATFEEHRREFEPLLCDVPSASDNDLLSIEKYRGTGVTYFAPPLGEAIALFERRFHVRAVYFGPYDLSQYFPLILASKV